MEGIQTKRLVSSRVHEDLVNCIDEAKGFLVDVTQKLIQSRSETPPGDTYAVARVVGGFLQDIESVDISFHPGDQSVQNLIAVAKGAKPGRKLVLNGHLDTYPAGDHALWSINPFSGTIRSGRVYGRGAADMKGGIACMLHAFRVLARNPNNWAGEVALVLAGDEESMGVLGSKYLLDNVASARGDAMLCADVGSPLIPRIGEKGMIWIDIFSKGISAHGAHVHRGVNAIDILRNAMNALEQLSDLNNSTPREVLEVIDAAKAISEPISGTGETEVLQKVTVNYGRIEGGQSANLVADHAKVSADIRIPLGYTVSDIESKIDQFMHSIDGVTYEILRRYEPTWTPPNDPLVSSVKYACERVLGTRPVVNMRVGASDARLYRAENIPTVVCGLTPNNLGAADEYVEIQELVEVAQIHTLAALTYLNTE